MAVLILFPCLFLEVTILAQINVSNLSFCYEGSFDYILENVSFSIDSNWRCGFVGRNGKGKTTFLNLLLGKYEYEGSISTNVIFDYFPYEIKPEWLELDTVEVLEKLRPEYEFWKVCRECSLLGVGDDVFYRPFSTLSHGERTKLLLALLFSEDNYFLLIDEPTNHLDMEARKAVRDYLKTKKGFLLVSHDRWLLDSCVDYILAMNRSSIRIEKGNFSSWWENKQRQDAYEMAEDSRLRSEIGKLEEAARRTGAWADKSESTKIGFDPIKEHDRSLSTRSYISAKTKKMQSQRKNLEQRQNRAIEEKKGLLKDIEKTEELKLTVLEHFRDPYVHIRDLSVSYPGADEPVFAGMNFDIEKGERVILRGANGCGKSSLIKAILDSDRVDLLGAVRPNNPAEIKGILEIAPHLKISYINQDTSFLKGKLDDHIRDSGLDMSLVMTILRKLDFERVQFTKNMENYSEGQKKKVLIACSLARPAHLYIWDEPLNYIDVFSRMQIEKLILDYKPTMLLVEHDQTFTEKIGGRVIEFSKENQNA